MKILLVNLPVRRTIQDHSPVVMCSQTLHRMFPDSVLWYWPQLRVPILQLSRSRILDIQCWHLQWRAPVIRKLHHQPTNHLGQKYLLRVLRNCSMPSLSA